MKPIELSDLEWTAVCDKLSVRYADRPSILLIRDKMKRELGFTIRYHTAQSNGWPDTRIFLDFYSDEAATMFRLTYL